MKWYEKARHIYKDSYQKFNQLLYRNRESNDEQQKAFYDQFYLTKNMQPHTAEAILQTAFIWGAMVNEEELIKDMELLISLIEKEVDFNV